MFSKFTMIIYLFFSKHLYFSPDMIQLPIEKKFKEERKGVLIHYIPNEGTRHIKLYIQ